ncbi:M24 family metallopeptidase [Dietzia sp.]|uniref:M24 family metallopeptidase n=1 Tax=Dietzia sp. TaxID=1871616 RepID=UPI002FD8DDBE
MTHQVSHDTSAAGPYRVARLAEALRAAEAKAGIAFPGADLFYLLGAPLHSHERLTALVVPAEGTPTLVIPDLEATASVRAMAADAGAEVSTWQDGEDPIGLTVAALGDREDTDHLLVSDDAPARHVVPLQDTLGHQIHRLAPVIDGIREVKTAEEIDELAAAGAAIDRVHRRMGEFLRVGRTEAEVAADIDAAIREEGHTHADFIIVGSGQNGADPHHDVSDRVIEAGDIVVVDIGGPIPSGFNSDSTRTYSMGEPSAAVAAEYAVLEEAQARARAAVRPGAKARDIDAAAREHLASAGIGERFVHRTGHGIGLSVHESPYISANSDTVLAEGMAFSIEPGIYARGEWGARLEDIVVVTADGIRELNNAPRGLRVLG